MKKYITPIEFINSRPPELNSVKDLYLNDNRHYHTLSRAESMIINLKTLFISTMIGDEFGHLLLAILYHDCVCDPKSKTNEEDSSKLMRKDLVGKLNPKDIVKIHFLIMATKHDRKPTNEIERAIIDLDLLGFAGSRESFSVTTQLIRKEYSHLSEKEWILGRIQFLEMMLKKKTIFHTEKLQQLNPIAFENINKELEEFKEKFQSI